MDWQLIIILGSLALIANWLGKKNDNINKRLLLAATISFFWVSLSGIYGYRDVNYSFMSFNLFAFFAWTAGLMFVNQNYDRIKIKKNKFLIYTIFYMVSMIIVEYIGYNYLGIKLETNYPGIFGIEAMHMPLYGQVYYLLSGPAYIKISEVFKLR